MKKIIAFILSICLSVTTRNASALNVGDSPADLSLKSNKGDIIQLSTLRGKVVFIDFWASWCASCAQSVPWLDGLQKKLGNDKFQILAINLDEQSEAADAFLKKNNADLLVAYDPAGKTPEAFQMKAMPTSYLLDKNGKIVFVHEGFKQKDAEEIEKEIQKAL